MEPDLEDLAGQFRAWSDSRRGVSPLYEILVGELCRDAELLEVIAKGLPTSLIYYKFMAAVHYSVLSEGGDLGRYYGTVQTPLEPSLDAYAAFREHCLRHSGRLLGMVRSCEVQINEVRRCSAVLLGLMRAYATGHAAPLAVIDVGTCAGFTLNFDKYFYDYGDGGQIGAPNAEVRIVTELRGGPVPDIANGIPTVGWRVGIDPAPVNIADPDSARWLTAFASPDDESRQDYIRRASSVMRRHPVRIDKGYARELLPAAMSEAPSDCTLCVVHALTDHHFDNSEREAFKAALKTASKGRTVNVISLEWPRLGEAVDMSQSLVLTLTTYNAGHVETASLGRLDRRGTADWIDVAVSSEGP